MVAGQENKLRWQLIYIDNFINFLNTIDLSKDYNQLNFLNSAVVSADLQNLYLPKGYEWLASEPANTKDVSIIIIRSEEKGTEFQVRDGVTKLLAISSPSMIYQNMEVGTVTGDMVVTGAVRAGTITGIDNAPVNIESARFKQLFVDGSQIVPTSGNTSMNMGFKTDIYTLYKDKVIGNGKSLDTDSLSLLNESNRQDSFKCPEVILDYNFCGNVYFFAVRPFVIARKPLVDTYLPDGSVSLTGFGRFSLPVAINPYSFPIMARQRQGESEENTTAVVTSYDTSTYEGTYTPNAANYYLLATTKFTLVNMKLTPLQSKLAGMLYGTEALFQFTQQKRQIIS